MTWSPSLRRQIKEHVPLARFTTFGIGGCARYFFEPASVNALASALRQARKNGIGYYIIGKGSNLLINDAEVNGLVIRLSKPAFSRLVFKKGAVVAGAGVPLKHLIDSAKKRGYGGCEFLAGIPGTVGGALVMNAGIKEGSIGDLALAVTVIDEHTKLRTVRPGDLAFGYRTSNLSRCVVMSVTLRMVKKPRQQISRLVKQYLLKRFEGQDYAAASAGCVFKNPSGESAGRLIDQCGFKGTRIGKAEVSTKHANFIINKGNARARDVVSLIGAIKNRVKEQFDIDLEPEIKIW